MPRLLVLPPSMARFAVQRLAISPVGIGNSQIRLRQ